MSCAGRCHRALDQSTGGMFGARSNSRAALTRSSCGVSRVEHRPYLVLLAIQPGDEEHLHRAAAVPVALLVIGLHAADAGAKALHVHGGVRRMPERRDGQLILGGRRASGGADLPVRPRPLREPLDRIDAVGRRRAQDVVVALREEVPALVLHHVRVPRFTAASAAVMSAGTPLRTSQKLKLYGVRTNTIGTGPDASFGR